ncbi:hypothetical protein B0H13DRAFT_2338704 [Mycena leptocephala]|nr:hypothetical protein B0H13DRAFT_2338704 [Mycena leptocephala]
MPTNADQPVASSAYITASALLPAAPPVPRSCRLPFAAINAARSLFDSYHHLAAPPQSSICHAHPLLGPNHYQRLTAQLHPNQTKQQPQSSGRKHMAPVPQTIPGNSPGEIFTVVRILRTAPVRLYGEFCEPTGGPSASTTTNPRRRSVRKLMQNIRCVSSITCAILKPALPTELTNICALCRLRCRYSSYSPGFTRSVRFWVPVAVKVDHSVPFGAPPSLCLSAAPAPLN